MAKMTNATPAMLVVVLVLLVSVSAMPFADPSSFLSQLFGFSGRPSHGSGYSSRGYASSGHRGQGRDRSSDGRSYREICRTFNPAPPAFPGRFPVPPVC